MSEQQAKVIVFTGNGKGKTTSALGLAVAAAVHQRRAVVVQFLKGGGYTGELFAADYLKPWFTIRQFGYGCPFAAGIKDGTQKCNKCGLCFRENRNPANGYGPKAFQFAQQTVAAEQPDLLVLDEISHALRHRLIDEDDVIRFIAAASPATTLVLTGRNMPERILALADQVIVCHAVKHPMSTGVDARRGIEY